VVTVERRRVRITGSIGIALRPQNGSDAEVLLRSADYAMYLAKKGGKDAWAFCPEDLTTPDEDPPPGSSLPGLSRRSPSERSGAQDHPRRG
jgi:hypothetical protein